MIPTDSIGEISERKRSQRSDPDSLLQTLCYFILALLGFSFWFLIAVPFASHRESYWWLAMVHSHGFTEAFSLISKTYRPLAQAATWLGFMILDPRVFPTSPLRQTVLQGLIYCLFALSWWLIYCAAVERRLLALVAFVTGGVFFSGYVQLFHIYGIFYAPVMLMLGAVLLFHRSRTPYKGEAWLAAVATLLVLWHPFATALFVGFYFGFYLDTFRQRNAGQHLKAVTILFAGLVAIGAMVVVGPRFWPNAPLLFLQTATMPVSTRLAGFLASYQTSEVNLAASVFAFLLTQLVVFSMVLSPRLKLAVGIVVSVLSVAFVLTGLPLLLLWLCAALTKLCRLRCWSLAFVTLAAALLPFGGGIGTPIYALFAIIMAAYATALGWSRAERALSFVKIRYVVGAIVTLMVVMLMVREGIDVPIVTRGARPLLAERERTFQLENILAWLHSSEYCDRYIGFVDDAGNPIDSVKSAITRQNRPPAALSDVQFFWNTVLKCQKGGRRNQKPGTVIVTFGGSALSNSKPVFEVGGRYAGDATVWIGDSQN